MRILLTSGILIQFASVLTLTLQNLLAPKILGADSYGVATALISLPSMIQGFLEAMANNVAIAARSHPQYLVILGKSWSHVLMMGAVGGVLSIIRAFHANAKPSEIVALAVFTIFLVLNTVLRSVAFSATRYKTVVMHYWAGLLAFSVILPSASFLGSQGYILALSIAQAAIFVILARDAHVLSVARSLLSPQTDKRSMLMFPFISAYTAGIAPRIATLALGPSMLVVASFQLEPSHLSEFKLCQALSSFLLYLTPVHPALLQSEMSKSLQLPTRPTRTARRPAAFLAVIVTLLILPTAGLMYLYPHLTALLLDQPPKLPYHSVMLLASPIYAALPLLSSLVLSLNTGWRATAALAAPAAVALGLALVFPPEWGFALGSLASFISSSCTSYLLIPSKAGPSRCNP